MRRSALILLVAFVIGGCSVGQPQAPLAAARQLNTWTSEISSACGELDQLSAFPPPPAHAVAALRSGAASAAHQLAELDRRHPRWIFDGATVRTLVNQARTMLRGCGLKSVAEQLKRDTA